MLFSVNGAYSDSVGVFYLLVLLHCKLFVAPCSQRLYVVFTSLLPCFPISAVPQTLHSKHSIVPERAEPSSPLAPQNLPKPTGQIASQAPPHTRARFAPHQSHPTAATRETTPPPARSPP